MGSARLFAATAAERPKPSYQMRSARSVTRSVRAGSAASRLRSLRSPLRDLDPAYARPKRLAIGASRRLATHVVKKMLRIAAWLAPR